MEKKTDIPTALGKNTLFPLLVFIFAVPFELPPLPPEDDVRDLKIHEKILVAYNGRFY